MKNHETNEKNQLTELSKEEMCSMAPSAMRQITGGRCWDGPLGDRDGCPSSEPSDQNDGHVILFEAHNVI